MRARARVGLGWVLALATATAGVVTTAPLRAEAQARVVIVQMPFTGTASDDLLRDVEDGVRNAVLARGATGPDRSTVRGSLGVDAPRDTTGLVQFGRVMNGTHVLTGQVTPLTGQYNLTLRLYEVSSSRMAEQHRNVGEGEEPTAIPEMLTALFAPGALQASPEEQRRLDEERQRQEAERRQQEEQRQRDEARRREDEARRRREAEERSRRVYQYAEGGVVSLGAALVAGGRISSVVPRAGQPPADSAMWGVRLEGGYAVLPAVGFEVGGAMMFVGLPTSGFTLGATARLAWPTRGALPLRGSVGAVAGLFQGFSGARATSGWLGLDVRAEYDVIPQVTLFAGVTLDGVPSVFSSFGGIIGARFRFGDRAPGGSQGTPVEATTSSAQ